MKKVLLIILIILSQVSIIGCSKDIESNKVKLNNLKIPDNIVIHKGYEVRNNKNQDENNFRILIDDEKIIGNFFRIIRTSYFQEIEDTRKMNINYDYVLKPNYNIKLEKTSYSAGYLDIILIYLDGTIIIPQYEAGFKNVTLYKSKISQDVINELIK